MKVPSSSERIKIFNASTGKIEDVEKAIKTDGEWKKILTPQQYQVTRLKGTGNPYSLECKLYI